MSMSGFLMNNQIYETQANNQLAILLTQFDADYVIEVMDDTLTQVFTHFDTIPRPNIVKSFETVFKELKETYPNDLDNIDHIRLKTYQTIIRHICDKYALRFIETNDTDLFTIADLLYDFFIAKLNSYMIQFYVKLLIEEKESALSMINMEEIKRSKDPSIVYNKMAYNNDEFAAIAINIPMILQNLANNLQVLDKTVYEYVYGKQPIVNFLSDTISSTVPIFSRFNNLLFNKDLYGPIITHIRMLFQQTVVTPPA